MLWAEMVLRNDQQVKKTHSLWPPDLSPFDYFLWGILKIKRLNSKTKKENLQK